MNATVNNAGTNAAKNAGKIADALPTPFERLQADVVLYDAQCRLCTQQVRRLAGLDRGGRLAFLPLDDPEVARRWPQLRYEDLMRQMHIVDPAGRVYPGAEALRLLTRRVPRLYWLMPLVHLPGTLPLWQWLYLQVARHRYRLGRVSCDEGTCSLHGAPRS